MLSQEDEWSLNREEVYIVVSAGARLQSSALLHWRGEIVIHNPIHR